MSSQYFAGKFSQLTGQACVIDTTPPTFAGIASAVFQTDGSALVSWLAGSTTKAPLRYEIFVGPGTLSAAALFVTANRVAIAPSALLALRIFTLRDQVTYFLPGQLYTFGVRAVDSQNYVETNTVVITQTALYPNYATLAASVWDVLRNLHTISGSFGEALQSKVDVDVSTRLAAAAYTAPDNAGIAAIKAKTDNLPATPADQTTSLAIKAKTDNLPATPADQTTSLAIKAKTDNLPTDPASNTVVNTRAPASSALDSAVWTNTKAGFIDVAISSRLAAGSYTPPDNASISAIKAKTDNLPSDPASESNVSAVGSAVVTTNTNVLAVKAKTDNLPASPANEVTSAAIKAKTDQLLFNLDTGVLAHVINQTPLNPSDVADAVWDAQVTDHDDPGSFGENAQNPAINPQQVADAVWDEPIANHLTPGSTGKKLNDGPTGGGGGGTTAACLGITGALEVQNLSATLDNTEIAGTISKVIDLNC